MTGSLTLPIITESKATCERAPFHHDSRMLVLRDIQELSEKPIKEMMSKTSDMRQYRIHLRNFGFNLLLRMENSQESISFMGIKCFRLILRMFDRA